MGVWAAIVVEAGSLLFTKCGPLQPAIRLGVGRHELIEPGVEHFVQPNEQCVFRLELFRKATLGT